MSNQIPWLTTEYIQKFILGSFSDKELQVKDFEVFPGSKAGDGYLSQIFRIKINTTKKSISAIAKVLLNSAAVNIIENFVNVYEKEKTMLQNFLPNSLSKLQKPVRFFPTIYHADDDKRTLFMEDLCDDGYQLCEHSYKGLDLQHSLLVMDALAKLHGTSYLVFQENPSLTKNFEKHFNCEENKVLLERMTKQAHKAFVAVLDDWPLPEEYKNKLKNADDWTAKIIESWKRKDGQFNVMIQTDCHLNNLMFKYNKNGVESVKMIDFQLGTYHSFALDLLFFIFSSTETNVKINHLNGLIDRYYEILTGITGNIPNFKKQKLWEEFHERLFLGFHRLLTVAPIMMAPPQTKPADMDQIMADENKASMSNIYRNPKFQYCVEKLFPYFLQHNAI